MPSCYIHIQYGDIMPLDNTTIGKLNEMTTMINDKSKLGIQYKICKIIIR